MQTALSSLTALISGDYVEDFRKLFKPSSLISAGVFLALNLILVLPALRNAGVGAVIAFERLSTVGQVALGTLIFLTLAYVLHSLGPAFLSLTSGAALRDSPLIGRALKGYQEGRYERLRKDALTMSQGVDAQTQARALQSLALKFPDKDAIAPTGLGNVIAATSQYLLNQYGTHFTTFWPFMDKVVKKQDEDRHTRINENRDALTFLCTLTVLLFVVAFEVILVQIGVGNARAALWFIPLVVFAVLAYFSAVEKAEAWSQDIRACFGLYLDEMATEMGLSGISATHPSDDRRDVWLDISRWLAYGGLNITSNTGEEPYSLASIRAESGWFQTQTTAPDVSLYHPSTIKVTRILESRVRRKGEGNTLKEEWQYIYTLTNDATGEHARTATGLFLLVADPGWAKVEDNLPGDLVVSGNSTVFAQHTVKARKVQILVRGNLADALMWQIRDLKPGATSTLLFNSEFTVAEFIFKSKEVR